MKIDTYTKVLLTGIFLFLGVIAFDLKPDIEAQASSSGGVEMIVNTDRPMLGHLKDGKIRFCTVLSGETYCYGWHD